MIQSWTMRYRPDAEVDDSNSDGGIEVDEISNVNLRARFPSSYSEMKRLF